jgi:hypothetical protein
VNVGDAVEQQDTRDVYEVLDTALLEHETGYVQIGTRPFSLENILTNGLIAYWRLDEQNGVRADATGNGNDLSDSNGTGYAEGKIGNAASFDGTQILSCPVAGMTADEPFTVSFWAKYDLAAQPPHDPDGAGSSPGWVNGWQGGGAFYLSLTDMASDHGAGPGWYVMFGAPSGSPIFAPAPASNAWQHIAVAYDGTTASLFINGAGVGNGDGFSFGAWLHGIRVGWQDDPYVGLIDEIGLWNRGLSSDEIEQLYNNGNGFAYPFA